VRYATSGMRQETSDKRHATGQQHAVPFLSSLVSCCLSLVTILLVSCCLSLVAIPAAAAEISFDSASGGQASAGGRLTVEVVLNAGEEDINAVAGRIIYPADLLELQVAQEANSIVSLWIEKPQSAYPGEVVFSGITPGGYEGGRGLLFTLNFIAQKEGQGTIELKGAEALQNDGDGTPSATLLTPSLPFAISGQETPDVKLFFVDEDPPETFQPEIARDSTIADGMWFLAFNAHDKGSGIDHYEIKETRQRLSNPFVVWTDGISPYILQDQELRSIISVKAVDKVGNERVEEVLPLNPLPWYEDWGNWVLLILAIAVLFTAAEILWRKRLRK
jgi:hypothetical protein